MKVLPTRTGKGNNHVVVSVVVVSAVVVVVQVVLVGVGGAVCLGVALPATVLVL